MRIHKRHMTICARTRLCRVVERARTLTRYAAGLPVVIFVESAEPAILVHRDIEMHLVACRAKVCIVSHERLHERPAMCLGRRIRYEPFQTLDDRIRTARDLVKWRV